MLRRLFAALVLASVALPAWSSEYIRAAMEQLAATGRLDVAGEPIAASGVLPAMYEQRGFEPLWATAADVDVLLGEIVASEGDGLEAGDYHLAVLRGAGGDAGPALSRDERDILLSDAFARLASHLYRGKVDPVAVDGRWNIGRSLPVEDPVTFLLGIIEGGRLAEGIDQLRPQHPAYGRLKSALARYRSIAAEGGWTSVPSGPTLRVGDEGPRVAALWTRLAATEPFPETVGATPAFDEVLEGAVKSFQARHGLDADGVVGSQTLSALNVPVDDRIDQIRVNLERARWVFRNIGGRQVVVDIAGFEVYVLEEGRIIWRSRTQVGRPYRQTPVFRDDIRYLVVNPDWTVPRGILSRDVLPSIQRDRAYLERQNMRVLTPGGEEVDPADVDWDRYTGRNFPYIIRQDPGPNNALGRIKIMFPNDYAVYLHDTPARALYDQTERAFSSGCIRVEDAFELGAILLDDPETWTAERLEAAATGTQPRTISLPQPWPVLLLYWTVSVSGEGLVVFRPDVYERDAAILGQLRSPFRP